MECLWLWPFHAGQRGFVALAFPAHHPLPSPSQCGVLILLIVYAYPMFFTSSPLAPIHWHSLQEEGKMRALTALEDKFNRNWWKWPKKVLFYYSCREKGYQGLMEPQSLAEVFLWLRSFGVYWTWKGIRRESEREINLKYNWCVHSLRRWEGRPFVIGVVCEWVHFRVRCDANDVSF